jgi:nucleoside-diphosphate-sugar epimerase
VTSNSKQLMVTGAAGFLGSRIVHWARQGGWQVRAFDRAPLVPGDGIEMFLGDMSDTAVLRKACEGMTAIVHAAGLAHVFGPGAKDAARFNEINEAGTGRVVDAGVACGVENIVLISSVSVYGAGARDNCDETAPCKPLGPYATSKWLGELKGIERMGGRGSLTILRLATLYGEGDRGNVARLVCLLDGGRFIWPGSGLNRKSLLYKDDAARACVVALERPTPGTGTFNVSAAPATMREIVASICTALGRPVPRLGVPQALLKAGAAVSRALGDPRQISQQFDKFIRDDVYSGKKFATAFDFCPAVSLAEGVEREVSFLQSRGMR